MELEDLKEVHPAVWIWLGLMGLLGLTYWSQYWYVSPIVSEDNQRNFPPPEMVRMREGTPVLWLANASPEPMRVDLASSTGEELFMELPACEECRIGRQTGEAVDVDCSNAEVVGYEIPPGSYEAKISFSGQTTLRSEWTISDDGEYEQCIITVLGQFDAIDTSPPNTGATDSNQIKK